MSKKVKVEILMGFILAAVFILAVVLFVLQQYEFKLLNSVSYNGFEVAFGNGDQEGILLFCVPFFLSIAAAAAAVLASLKILKINSSILFAVCAVFALFSAIVYLSTYFGVLDSYRTNLIDLSDKVNWAFAFWAGFSVQCVALAGSVYASVMGIKNR
ncbi:MAG: hypothetical protein FWE53_04800 [Firmicutes bacterium]|nr:hypothetical protein [Bacillota bacterium]